MVHPLLREDAMLEKTALVAELYYIYKLPQKKIAEQLGISRPWVSKLLKRAEETGIVTIKVKTAWAGEEELEEEMISHFGLKGCKVIQSATTDAQTLQNCARAASHYLVSIIQPKDVIALSWGYTLAAFAEEFAHVELRDVTFLPMMGGVGADTRILSNYIVDKIATRTHAQYQLLHLPAFAVGKEQKESLLTDPLAQEIIKSSENADIIMYSLGSLYHSTMVRDGYPSPQELEELAELGAVGDIALQFIDKNGTLVEHPIRHRLVSGDFQKARNHARHSVALAIGESKVEVIKAALRGGWLDVLVTDTNTANMLLTLK